MRPAISSAEGSPGRRSGGGAVHLGLVEQAARLSMAQPSHSGRSNLRGCRLSAAMLTYYLSAGSRQSVGRVLSRLRRSWPPVHVAYRPGGRAGSSDVNERFPGGIQRSAPSSPVEGQRLPGIPIVFAWARIVPPPMSAAAWDVDRDELRFFASRSARAPTRASSQSFVPADQHDLP